MVLWACILGFIACTGARTVGNHDEAAAADEGELTTTGHTTSTTHALDGQEERPPDACPSLTQPCKEALSWAMHWGIYQRPEWYPNMTPSSPSDDFQRVIFRNQGPCPRPCGRHPEPTRPEAMTITRDPADPTTYCWLMMNTKSYELALVQSQFYRKVGVFACDAHSVFSNAQVTLGGTEESIPVGAFTAKPAPWGSYLNTDDFLRAWGKLVELQIFKENDWTIKADPDTVFFAHRLRQHLRNTPRDRSVYFKNWREQFGFFGPLEVFSRLAVEAFAQGQDGCRRTIGTDSSGEDGWMHSCMEYLGVGFPEDFDLLDASGSLETCRHTHVVAFHAFKQADRYFDCVKAGMQADAPLLPSTSLRTHQEERSRAPLTTSTTVSARPARARPPQPPTTTRAQTTSSSPAFLHPASKVTVVRVDHQDSKSASGGRYFFFEPDAWASMVGSTSWASSTFAIVQTRDGADIWHGDVVVWDNQDGTYGRRESDEADGQWQPGDVITLQADQQHSPAHLKWTGHEDFCCFAAPNRKQACTACYDGARAVGGYCGSSKSRCMECGNVNATWCPAGVAGVGASKDVPLKTSKLDSALKSFLQESEVKVLSDASADEHVRAFNGYCLLGGAVLALALAALATMIPLRSRQQGAGSVEGAEARHLFLAHAERAIE